MKIHKTLVALASSAALLALPLVAAAAFDVTETPVPSVNSALDVSGLINLIFNSFFWPVIVVIIIIFLIIIGLLFLFAQGEPEKVAVARQALIWGIAGIAVVVIAFSLIVVVRNAIGV